MTTIERDGSTTCISHGQSRARFFLSVAVLAGALVLAGRPVDAQQPDEGPGGADEPTTTEPAGPPLAIGGTLRFEGDPLEDVTVIVTAPDGTELEGTTGSDGTWRLDVPSRGAYTVAIDPTTLPDGLIVREGGETRTVQAERGLIRQVAFPVVEPGEEGEPVQREQPGRRSTVDRLVNRSVDGLKFGLIIAMAAIGLSLIFATTGLINFAHGELVTFGAVAAWFLNAQGPQLALVYAALIAVALAGIGGSGLELGVWRPLRRRRAGLFQLMVISIGLSLLFRQALLIWFGSDTLRYTDYTLQERLELGPISITPRDLTIMAIAVACLVAVALMLQKTRIGKAMRAVADNVDLAESSGIDVRRVILFVWVSGTALAALGGVLQATATTVNYLMGFQLLLLMFAAVILGGLGTAYGAMVGGIVVGLATEISTVWLSSELKFVWALFVLIVVLLFRPQGILGERERVA